MSKYTAKDSSFASCGTPLVGMLLQEIRVYLVDLSCRALDERRGPFFVHRDGGELGKSEPDSEGVLNIDGCQRHRWARNRYVCVREGHSACLHTECGCS